MAEVPIPENIRIGIDTKEPDLLKRRKDWNTASDLPPCKSEASSLHRQTCTDESQAASMPPIGLPTEIWRETIARLERYFELKRKIAKGEINEISDLITCNLDIRRLIQEYLEQTADKAFISNFYTALINITILDPTCGSGAFLFAALNILEPLYEVCLQRMEEFWREDPEGNRDFEGHLLPLLNGEHPGRGHYIFKTIILNNLYGVDLMKEAVEIAKLRLSLKLVAEVDPSRRKKNFGIEPLPDIDFNIRSGNTLVGFATEKQLEEVAKNAEGGLICEEKLSELKLACESAAARLGHFQKMQMVISSDSVVIRQAKQDYAQAIKTLDEKLNRCLADMYGIGTKTRGKNENEKEQAYRKWEESHHPFHWFAEFYGIISKGGFDVVIGNPPYLELRQIEYEIKGLKTVETSAVHAMCIERSFQLLNKAGNTSMIVPLSLVSTQRMANIQKMIEEKRIVWYANFGWRPGKLFNTVNRALTIFVSNCSKEQLCNTGGYIKWHSGYRDAIFESLSFIAYNSKRDSYWAPKLSSQREIDILNKVLQKESTLQQYISVSQFKIYYKSTGIMYWRVFTPKPPIFLLNGKKSASSRETSISLASSDLVNKFVALFSSSLYWWWGAVTSNMRDLNPSDLFGFKFNRDLLNSAELAELSKKYVSDIDKNSVMMTRAQKTTGSAQIQSYKIAKSKPIIDEIDKVLAKHYGFTEEELDFIINYDIKYRMGSELEGEG
jgi:hypothetical protein